MRARVWGLAAVTIVAVAAVVVVPLVVGRTASSSPRATPAPGPGVVSTVSPPTLAATRVARVAPVDARGRLVDGYRVDATARGHCFSSSLLDGRLYRCFRGDTILDPCWRGVARDAVLCLPAPWTHRVVRLRLTSALPQRDPFPGRWWALRAGDGLDVRCTAAMGATGLVGHRRISFLCDRGWVLLGNGPDRSDAAWTMTAARRVHGRYRVRGPVHLSVAWRPVTRS